jgi:hypothetical protein
MKVQILVTQPVDNLPNVFKLHHGILYSRWFVLSALFDLVLAILGYLSERIFPYPPGFLRPFWHISTWNFLDQCLLVAGILILFLLGSIVAFLFGYRFFEPPINTSVGRKRSRSINFENLHWLLGIYAVLIFGASLYGWLLKKMQPVPFALMLIFLFITAWTACHNMILRKATEHLNKEQRCLLSARYLFCCLFHLDSFVRPNPETILEGTKLLPEQPLAEEEDN